MQSDPRVTLLAGGVGAARLLRGLARVVDPEKLCVVVNTGDDEEFYGLHVSPDLDTIVYTLAGLAPLQRGWGIQGDTMYCRDGLETFYGSSWFAIGDRDLATHVFRSDRLRSGARLSAVTAEICSALSLRCRVLPMSDDPVRTFVKTAGGELPFQDYLVRRKARPRVLGLSFRGARKAAPSPAALDAIEQSELVLIAPSNPFVSIAPMLAIPGFRRVLKACRSKVVAVSPLIAGRAVKGPLASMMKSLGEAPGVRGIAAFYRGLAGRLLVAPGDLPKRGLDPGWPRMIEHDILISRPESSERLARFLLGFAQQRGRRRGPCG